MEFLMIVKSLVRWLGMALLPFLLTFAPIFAAVFAADDPHKMSVVSFGLFGGQEVFRSEAIGGAQIVASHFGGSPVIRFNTKMGGSANVEALKATLQATARQLHGDSDVSHPYLARPHSWPCCHGGTAI